LDGDCDGASVSTCGSAVILGDGQDATISYDGTNLVINPRLVGTGALVLGTGAAGVDYRFQVNGETNDGYFDWMEDEDYFDFADTVRVPSLHLDADVAGIASTNTITGATDTPTADPGWASSSTVNMTAPDGYIKAYVGTQAVVIPYWNT
jgi:hypothetical protein